MTTVTETKAEYLTIFYNPQRDTAIASHDKGIPPLGGISVSLGWNPTLAAYDFIHLRPYLNQNVDVEKVERLKQTVKGQELFNDGILSEIPQKAFAEDNLMRTYSQSDAIKIIGFCKSKSLLLKWRENTTHSAIAGKIEQRLNEITRGNI